MFDESGAIIVKLRRAESIKTQLGDLKRLIETLNRSEKRLEPRFRLSASHSIVDKALRATLRFRQIVDETGSLETAALKYVAIADARNGKVQQWNARNKGKRAKHSFMFVSAEVRGFAEEVSKLDAARQKPHAKAKQSDSYRRYRQGTQRILKKFDKLIRNVAKGQFPGRY